MDTTRPAIVNPASGNHLAEGHAERSRIRRGELVAIFAFWTFVALLTAANRLIDPRVPALQAGVSTGPIALAFIEAYLWAALTPLIFLLTSRFALERSNLAQRLLLFGALGLLVSIFVDVATAYVRIEVFQIVRRLGIGFNPAFRVSRLWFLNDLMVYFAVLAAGIARDYFLRYRARQEESVRLQAHAAQLQAQLAEARLATLRTQIDPHFLFNTLHAVSTLVERDPRGVRRMIARLSELLRHSLEEADEQETSLSDELDFTRRYLEIMEIRFQGRLEVSTDADPALGDALVPNLILQPLVENAVKHGVSNLAGIGRIHISGRREDERLVLAVSDNGPGLRDWGGDVEEGFGLRNARERLAQLYGSEQSLTLRPTDGGGLTVEVELPYHTRADLVVAEIAG